MFNLICLGEGLFPPRKELEGRLREKWPRVTIERLAPDSAFEVRFVIDEQGWDVEGRVSRGREGMSLEATDLQNAARFAVWVRTLVDDDAELALVDDSGDIEVAVSSSARPEDLISQVEEAAAHLA